MTVIKNRIEKNFTIVSNQILQNENLTWGARGLLCFLMSLPDGWDLKKDWLYRQSSQGKQSTETLLKELNNQGYVLWVNVKNPETSKFDSFIEIHGEPQNFTDQLDKLIEQRVNRWGGEKPYPETSIREADSDTNRSGSPYREKELAISTKKEKIDKKESYGPNEVVKLTKKQLEGLIEEHGEKIVEEKILDLNDYILAKEPKYKDHSAVLRQWIRKDQKKHDSSSRAYVGGKRLEEYDNLF